MPDRDALLEIAKEMRDRADQLLDRYAPEAGRREDKFVMIGDAAVMQLAASLIEKELAASEPGPCTCKPSPPNGAVGPDPRCPLHGYTLVNAIASDTSIGLALIAAERRRQRIDEGWDDVHDDFHDGEQLALAAAAYAIPMDCRDYTAGVPFPWPWDEKWWKPGDRIRELTKAGALVAAEIDRLFRRPASSPTFANTDRLLGRRPLRRCGWLGSGS